jgi:UrcA family protein
MLLSACLAGGLAEAGNAQPIGMREEIRIAVTGDEFKDERALADVRRKIGIAARELCGSHGLGALYRNESRRCRERIALEAERQLQRSSATRMAGVIKP